MCGVQHLNMIKNNLFYLNHIKENLDDIDSFMKNVTREKFNHNKEKQKAVIKSIETIGEAIRKLPDDFIKKYTNVEWSQIIAMRNILSHQYFRVDLDVVWKTIFEDLPKLRIEIQKIINLEKI